MATQTTLPGQQAQASTYNHPCGYLLENGTGRDYFDIIVPLYKASITGDCRAARVILDRRRYLVHNSITENKETPLHVAVASHSTKFVRFLVNLMEVAELELQNRDGNTAFCLAVIAGNVGMVKIMLKKNSTLPNIRGRDNTMPLYLAAFHGKYDMVTYLYYQHQRMMENQYWTNDSRDEVLLLCIEAGIFNVALRILNDHKELPQEKNQLWHVLQILARNCDAFHATRPNIKQTVTSFLARIGLVRIHAVKESTATPLLRVLWRRTIFEKTKNRIDEILKGPINQMGKYPSHVLFIAARMNNAIFLVELIREYPDLIWRRNDDGQSIFHISVSHRYHDIYNLIYEIGSMKDQITTMTDQQGNNILHIVGMNAEKSPYEDLLPAPFKLQRESYWYKEVRDIVPPPCREVKNAAGQTPSEIYNENHKDLVCQREKWIKETIDRYMVVATLVAAVGFSAAISIPGGYDQTKRSPLLISNSLFISFTISNALSFFLSTISILIFLSVSLSYHTEKDSIISLPRQLYLGQVALLLSVQSLIFAFIYNFYSMYNDPKCSPLYLYFALLGYTYNNMKVTGCLRVIGSLYHANNLFRRKVRKLYPETHSTKCYRCD